MFDPDGYLPVHYIVAWVAGLGAQGKLPRHLRFVHPGDSAEFDDLPADAVARHVLGEKMAAGILPFIVVVSPSGDIYIGSANYWRSDGSHETMKDSRMDPRVLGLDADLNSARVLLHPDAVAAALGVRLAPLEGTPAAPARSAPTATPPDKIQDAYQACVACLRAIIEANPSYRTHTRGELKALCRGGLKEQAWRDALAEVVDPHSAWKETGRRKQR